MVVDYPLLCTFHLHCVGVVFWSQSLGKWWAVGGSSRIRCCNKARNFLPFRLSLLVGITNTMNTNEISWGSRGWAWISLAWPKIFFPFAFRCLWAHQTRSMIEESYEVVADKLNLRRSGSKLSWSRLIHLQFLTIRYTTRTKKQRLPFRATSTTCNWNNLRNFLPWRPED